MLTRAVLPSSFFQLTVDNGIGGRDHRPLIYELQRELTLAVLEIEKITQASRDLTRINQDLEESRLLAISDQARTAKRLLLMSSQLEYTEQKLFSLTKETEDGLKDSDLLRIERIKREALQEREDAGRLKIDALQDELREVQRSERTLQQKLLTIQTKFETLGQRHDQLRRQQQDVDVARESKEAVAWLKETTDRLCSPPQGSLGQAIQQEKSLQQGSTPINIVRSEPPSSSSSPPYQSSIADPPLAAQNQLISLIKELATANSTLRSELTEYRDLLQDSRNEVMDLRSQIEDYEQGHGFECCGGSFMQDSPGDLTISQGTWGTAMVEHQDLSMSKLKDAAGGPLPGVSPPPYMTAHGEHPPSEQHLHQHFHLPGVRGNVFGELERLYSQGNQIPPHLSSKRRSSRHHSSKKDKEAGAGSGGRRTSRDPTKSSHHHSKHGHHSHQPHLSHHNNNTATVSTSTSTSEARRALVPTGAPSQVSTPGSTEAKPRKAHDSKSLVHSRRMRSKKSLYTDADMDMLGSESDRNEYDHGSDDDDHDQGDPTGILAELSDSGNEQEPGFIAAFAETLSSLSFFSGPFSGSPP
ncbi:hypothetical protein EC957_004698 [Mortierella hygrophila]|uniref:Uncharacterized protein n=1 Tax=Mortierella hygrophila TaxID=979708 RepID=A0A9P6K025_9FUNG|nr:hypothetical protein EC957_004698 [Mortierella hygrophila]